MHVKLKMFEKPSSKLSDDIKNQFNEIIVLLKAKSVKFDKK